MKLFPASIRKDWQNKLMIYAIINILIGIHILIFIFILICSFCCHDENVILRCLGDKVPKN
jgi:hypothetical protein